FERESAGRLEQQRAAFRQAREERERLVSVGGRQYSRVAGPAVFRVPADRHDQVEAARGFAELPVVTGAFPAELTHVAEHGRPRRGVRPQNFQGGGRGGGIAVVSVVYEQPAV